MTGWRDIDSRHQGVPFFPAGVMMTERGWVMVDCMVALAGLVLAEVQLRAVHAGASSKGDAALAVVVAVSVVLRRRYPLPALVAAGASVAVVDGVGSPSWALTALLGLAGYTAALALGRRGSLVAGSLIVLGLVAAALANGVGKGGVTSALALVTAWAVGDRVAVRRDYQKNLAGHEELEQQQRAELTVRDERMRIARELHDGVAHALAVITLQAGAARRLSGSDGGVGAALEAIEIQGRAAQDGLDVVLGLMRDGPGAAERPPDLGLAELGALIASVRAAGTPVELRLLGTARVLPAHVQLTIYRIVQEALTNVVKHAPGAATTVDVAVSAGEARIEVCDIPSGPPRAVGDAGTDAGYGTTGMYERAAALGGSLRAEPLPGGGFRVLAHLPIGQWP